MNLRILRWLAVGFTAHPAVTADAFADENVWPLRVERAPASDAAPYPASWQTMGPLGFFEITSEGRNVTGLRPVWMEEREASGDLVSWHLLYPFLSYRRYPSGDNWSLLNLIVRDRVGHATKNEAGEVRSLAVWPLYFSLQTGTAKDSYRALFPIAGRVTHKFGFDAFSWGLFPLYGRFEKNGVTTTTAPWPFVKVLKGKGNSGLELWPLAGHREKPGVYRDQFLLWPLLQRRDSHLDDPTRRSHQAHFLPFYAVDRQPGYVSETFGWPFWGYVDRTSPYVYQARHYLWPLWVQGRGDERYVNRWAPFYTHSNLRGFDKTWIMWPVWRQAEWEADGLRQSRRQLLYFVYHATAQHSITRPGLTPARKVHLWPLYSSWDNGAGRRQVQALSPFEVFLPHNDIVRRLWSPLFALYRFDQSKPGDTRHSVLWDAITLEQNASRATTEFHLGPLLSMTRSSTRQRVSILGNLVGMERTPGERTWRLILGDRSFARSPASASPP